MNLERESKKENDFSIQMCHNVQLIFVFFFFQILRNINNFS